MLFTLSVLIFTTLTCVGLLALGAATSRWHWFLRAMLYLGAVSPVLAIPAYEPFVTFVVLGATVATGVQLARRRERRKLGETARAQLSLRDGLLAIPPVAVLCAVAVRLPALDVRTWVSVVAIGLVAGLVVLLAAWIATGNRLAWWGRLLIAVPVVLLLALPGVLGDRTLESFTGWGGWPPDPGIQGFMGGGGPTDRQAWLVLGFLVLSAATLLLWSLAPLWNRGPHHRAWRRFLAGCSVLLLLLFAIPPLGVYWRLMHPDPIPDESIPSPNGYDDLLAAAALLPKNPIVDGVTFDDETAPIAQLRSACREIEPAALRARQGIATSCKHLLDYGTDDLGLDEIQSFRCIARGMRAKGKISERGGRTEDAAKQYLELMDFGNCISNGGLLVDALVGIACAGFGSRGLYSIRDAVPADNCPHIAEKIGSIERRLDPIEDFLYRDRVWSQRAYGWYGHMTQILDDVSESESWSHFSYESVHQRHLATLRLLRLEFALRAYNHQHGKWPETLKELTPDLLTEVPRDPFAVDGAPLRYRREGDGYLLYSIGENAVDDGGEPAPYDADLMFRDLSVGDFRLDIHYAPDPVQAQPSDDDVDWVDPNDQSKPKPQEASQLPSAEDL